MTEPQTCPQCHDSAIIIKREWFGDSLNPASRSWAEVCDCDIGVAYKATLIQTLEGIKDGSIVAQPWSEIKQELGL